MGVQARDFKPIGTMLNEPVLLTGRFTGAGNAAPTVVTNTGKCQLTVIHNGSANSGNYTVSIPTPVGVAIQAYMVEISSGTRALKELITPPAANAQSLTFITSFATNAAATDLTSSEEMVVWFWLSASQTP